MQKNGIVRSSQANRRPNVTKASVRSPRDSVRYPLTVCGDPTTTVRPPCVLYKNVKGLRTDNARDPYDIYILSAEKYDCRTIALRFCMRTSTNGRSKNRTMPV